MLLVERATPQYQQHRQTSVHRQREEANYVEDFHAAVLDFLAFDAHYADLAKRLATAVTEHATPVGSGTVARTKRLHIERRAKAAVISGVTARVVKSSLWWKAVPPTRSYALAARPTKAEIVASW